MVSYNPKLHTASQLQTRTSELPCFPGYFCEPHWFSMGLTEIYRVTLIVMEHRSFTKCKGELWVSVGGYLRENSMWYFRHVIFYHTVTLGKGSETTASCVMYPLKLKRDSSAINFLHPVCASENFQWILISMMRPIPSALGPLKIMVHGSSRPLKKEITLNVCLGVGTTPFTIWAMSLWQKPCTDGILIGAIC